jgi:putative membrane protein
MYYFGHMGMGYFGLFGWIWIILFWAAVIWFIVWLATRTRTPEAKGSHIDILKERYARGEITKKQFEEMKEDLSK